MDTTAGGAKSKKDFIIKVEEGKAKQYLETPIIN